jgi:type VI secretion system secreted protein VgrG
MSQHTQIASLLAAFGRHTQDTRLLRLTTPLGDHLLAECMQGEEGISRSFDFAIDALSLDADLSLRALIGQPALLQLLTADTDTFRAFHGYVTAAEMTGANGGFARYALRLQPWTSFLALGRDSRVFQDMTVFDILDVVFGSYAGRARLAPAWRLEVADREVYPKRSLTTQYQESDLAFVERLLHEEGLFYFFAHEGDPDSATLGSHTMVIADHNGAFQPNAQAQVAFTQPGAVMKADSVDRWRTESRLLTNAVEMGSWDYRTVRQRQVSAAGTSGVELVSRDAPGVYAWETREQGQRIALNQVQACEAARQVHIAAGTVRTFVPGTRFTLHGHARFDGVADEQERSFVITGVTHLMHNNLTAEMLETVDKLLGQGAAAQATSAELRAVRPVPGERPLYRNRIEAIPAGVPYRSTGHEGHGRLLHPRPTVRGQQTAIVVGPPGAVVHTDRDHRIKVQFHWQRGVASHSRGMHPNPDGHTGAPGDDTAGTWVRIATPVAGANWGSNMVPRVGQEVLVDFIEGDIDRPVVIGALYNGRGQPDAQHNAVAHGPGAMTGNAPPWFPGESGGHGHAAVLSGFKSQAMGASQDGGGAYSQLVFDDTPGQSRISLQCHMQAHQGTAELNLGHITHQTDNERLATVGFGVELKTAHSLALRAGQGMLLSSDARQGASGAAFDAHEAVSVIEDCHRLQVDVASLAQKHNAKLEGEPAPEELPAVQQMRHSAEVIGAEENGAVAFSEPQLQLSSPAGIVATTPADAVISAGTTSSIVAGQDINMVAQGSASMLVAKGISLFTYGKATNKDKPNQEVGIKLHAASGKLSCQSQSGPTSLTADKKITVASVTKSVTVSAPKKHVLLTAQGAYIKLEGGNIEVHAPGNVEFKASKKELAGPQSSKEERVLSKPGDLKLCELRAAGAAAGGDSSVPLS